MTIKSIIALFLGLLIQFSQVQSSFADEAVKSCGEQGEFMSCCEGLRSCPCAKGGDSEQKPGPLIPATLELKPLLSKASETISLDVLVSPRAESIEWYARQTDSARGFAGVPLSVAFCRFLI